MEVLVVDGLSTDGTAQLAECEASNSDVPLKIIINERRTIPSALNLAFRLANGRYLVRIDAHAEVEPDYVEKLVGHLASGRWAGVGGRKIAIGRSKVGEAFSFAFRSRIGGGSTYHYGTMTREVDHVPFGAYPLSVVRTLGGWDEELLVNQDYEFDYRVRQGGGRILFDPTIVIRWRGRDTVRDIARQYFRYGRGKTVVARKHPRSLRLRQLGPPALVLTTGALFAVAASRRHQRLVFALVSTYWASVSLVGFRLARQNRASSSVSARVPFVLVTMHFSWGTGFLWGVVRGNRSSRGAWNPFRGNPC